MHPLRQFRRGLGITQDVMAREAGVSVAAISAYETGMRSPRLGAIRALVAATELFRPGCGLTAGQILGLEPYEFVGGGGDRAENRDRTDDQEAAA